jgi:pimeloyl-ACP methyl ester carboxylesterase
MNLSKRFLFLFVFVFMVTSVFALPVPADKEGKGMRSEKVDEIYDNIRHSGARYEWEEHIVNFQNEGMNIVGSLVIPKAGKKCPIVIFFNGYAGDRKELLVTGTDEYIWERLSRILAEQGLASLRIDFRGSGDSDGDFTMTTFSTQISDGMAAVEFVSRNLRRRVNHKKIGIIGFSQGGLVGACTTARDSRVDSLCLWSPVSHPPMVYENLFSKAGMKQGLALQEGETITLPIYVNEEYVDWDVPMGNRFFDQIFQIDPVQEVSEHFDGPLFALCGVNDPIIWPQPHQSNIYLRYHRGFEKLVMLDADHAFNWWDGSEPERFHDACYWSAAWFLYTLD